MLGGSKSRLCVKDHASTSQRCAAWSEKCHQQVPRRGTLFAGIVQLKQPAIMSAVSSLFHIVINTLRREMTIPDAESEQLYRYISSIVQSRSCRVLRINGIGNHVHLLVELSPTVCLSDLVRDIKQGSSKWAKRQSCFLQFRGWGKEYGAFSCSVRDKEKIINYIINQRQHHRLKTFEDEYRLMIERSGLEWNEYRLT